MRYRCLTQTISVSELCYGTLTLGPLQKGLTPLAGGRLLTYALEQGVNFFDTAELYGNYEHLRAALQGWQGETVIATKSYAHDAATAVESLERARKELNRDCVDIFLLHEQESEHTLRGHARALEYFSEAKARGLVRAVGISTHYIAGVVAAAAHPLIEIIHPLINMKGIGIPDGKAGEMAAAITMAATRGKGIYGMKALAGGSLYATAGEALNYVRTIPGISSIAVGMGSIPDIDANVSFFNTGQFPLEYATRNTARRIIVEPWCEGCGTCQQHCPTNCISITSGKACIEHSKCLLCCYCVAHCKDFYMKVIEC
ncbi:MAG: aldo/keto reductase [Bacillota bacterium]|nr:MAG: aldo/keto reductase [Bacillota bacterium]